MNNNFNRDLKQQPINDPFINRTFSEHDIDEFLFLNHADDGVVFGNNESFVGDGCCSNHLDAPYINLDNLNKFVRGGGNGTTGNHLWSQNINPNNSTIMMTVDSPSSICADSPASDTNLKRGDNNVVGVTSDYDPSDDDDTEIEAGQCEQSNDQMDDKKHKRMASNRESARRSRKRKQEHLTDLEEQVALMRAQYSDLFKQLTNASHQFKDASTNNLVLKSQVIALRANVKLAEDKLARGSLTSSLSHLLQNHLTTPQMFNSHNLSRMGNVSPTITVRADDHGPHASLSVPGQHMMGGLGTNPDIFGGNVKNDINNDGGSCVSNMWSG
ncbi:hypothetical protein QVD17_13781 [Tagetes erecta]|uniref:BZIP domain-containing protein n=1 Tax=Tagetes erecta TaxID=13708 RepID=A0AAD8L104_TARER|nr:hypothetical protein QVD17_13781 [Tagetes erecta]